MLRSIFEDLRSEFDYGNRVNQLVIVNVAVFILITALNFVLFLINGGKPAGFSGEITRYLAMSSNGSFVLTHPWILLTHLFLHLDFFHILWNMLLFIWFGRVTGDLLGDHRVTFLYVAAGLMGALIFYLSASFLAYGSGGTRMAIGASAAVMGIVVSAGVVAPDYTFRLLFVGDVKIKYIVLALLLIDMLSITRNANTGGHFAHLGGALSGWIYVRLLQEGIDLSQPFRDLSSRLQNPFRRPVRRTGRNPNLRVSHRRNRDEEDQFSKREDDYQVRLDHILDKIKLSGYNSLSDEEKEFLYEASRK